MDRPVVNTADGFEIACTIAGTGPLLLLLHGFSDDRNLWSRNRWIERLGPRFRVVAMDLRGCGESTASDRPQDYTVEHHLADVLAVADACGAREFRLRGWSFGATIGLQLAARSDRLVRAVISGSLFGRLFTEKRIQPTIAWLEPLAQAQKAGQWEELDLSPQQAALAGRTNLSVYLARVRGLLSWPGVGPEEIRCPVLVCTGTEDKNVAPRLQEQRPAIEAAGLQLHVFDGLDHDQLLSAIDVVAPVVEAFLEESRPGPAGNGGGE